MVSNTNNYNFGESLRALRLSKGLTQAEVARRMGVSPQSYYQYEHGVRKPKEKTIDAILSAIESSVDDLMDFTGEKPTDSNLHSENNYLRGVIEGMIISLSILSGDARGSDCLYWQDEDNSENKEEEHEQN